MLIFFEGPTVGCLGGLGATMVPPFVGVQVLAKGQLHSMLEIQEILIAWIRVVTPSHPGIQFRSQPLRGYVVFGPPT